MTKIALFSPARARRPWAWAKIWRKSIRWRGKRLKKPTTHSATSSRVCFEGPEDQLRLTEITQPAILTVSIAALRVLEGRIPSPLCRGAQPGRIFRACCFRNLRFADAVRTVRNRGKYMQEAVRWRGRDGRDPRHGLEKVAAVCHDAAQGEVCEPANINSPEQIVISGNTAAVERGAIWPTNAAPSAPNCCR